MMMPGPGGPPGAPGGMPPGGPPGAPPPGMMPPPQQGPPGLPSGAPVGGPSPASPTPFTDLSDKLPHHYQLLDVAASTIEQAINTGGFYKEPKVLAGIRSVHAQLATLIANGSKGSDFGSVPEGPSLTPSAGGDGPDDDEQPEEETSDEM